MVNQLPEKQVICRGRARFLKKAVPARLIITIISGKYELKMNYRARSRGRTGTRDLLALPLNMNPAQVEFTDGAHLSYMSFSPS
jgi:hypothetical protein